MSNSGTYPLFGSIARSASHNKALRSGDGTVTRPSRSSSSTGGMARVSGFGSSPGSMRPASAHASALRGAPTETRQIAELDRLKRPASVGMSARTAELLVGAPHAFGTSQPLRSPPHSGDKPGTETPALNLLSTHSSLEKKFHQLERLHSELQHLNSEIITGIHDSVANSAGSAEVAEPQSAAEANMQASHIYDVLSTIKTTNDAIKTDFQRELEALSQQLQTSLAENGELLRENLMLKDIISQKELHISDLTHFAKTKEKEVERLSDLLSTAERINNVKNIELKSYLDECANVSRHNESVIAERSSELQLLHATSEQLKVTLSVTKQELTDTQSQLTKLQVGNAALQTERDEFERRLKKVKANAEKFITQRDTEILRLKESMQQMGDEVQALKQKLKVITETLSSYKNEASNVQMLITRVGFPTASLASEHTDDIIPLASGIIPDSSEECPALRKLIEALLNQKDEQIKTLREEKLGIRQSSNDEAVSDDVDVQDVRLQKENKEFVSPEAERHSPCEVSADKVILTVNSEVQTEHQPGIMYPPAHVAITVEHSTPSADTPQNSLLAEKFSVEVQQLQDAVASRDSTIQSLRAEYERVRLSADSCTKEITLLNEKIAALQSELERSEQLIITLRQSDKTVELAVLQAKYDALNDNKIDSTALLNKYLEGEKHTEELRGKIYEALAREAELQSEKSELQAALSIAKAENEIMARRSSELEQSLISAKAQAVTTSDASAKVTQLERHLNEAQKTILASDKTIETLTSACKDLETKLAAAESSSVKQAEALNAALQEQKQQLEEREAEILRCKEIISKLEAAPGLPDASTAVPCNNSSQRDGELVLAKRIEEDLRRQLSELQDTSVKSMATKEAEIILLRKDIELANAKNEALAARVTSTESLSEDAKNLAQENKVLTARIQSLEDELLNRPATETVDDLTQKLDAATFSGNMLKTEIAALTQKYTELTSELASKSDLCVSLQQSLDSVNAYFKERENGYVQNEKALKNELESLTLVVEEKAVFIAQVTSKLASYENEQTKLQSLVEAHKQEAEKAAQKIHDLEALLDGQWPSEESKADKVALLSKQLAHIDAEKKSLVELLSATHKEVQLQAVAEKAAREHVVAIEERLCEANQEITALQDKLRIAEHKLSHRSIAESAEVLKLRDEIAFLTHKHRQEIEACNNEWLAQLTVQKDRPDNSAAAALKQELDATTKTLDRVILSKNAEIQALRKQLDDMKASPVIMLTESERASYESKIAELQQKIDGMAVQAAATAAPKPLVSKHERYADVLEKSMPSPPAVAPKHVQPIVFTPQAPANEAKSIDTQISFQPALTISSPFVVEKPPQASPHEKQGAGPTRLRSMTIQELLDRSRELNLQVGTLNADMNYFHEKLDQSLDLTTSAALRSHTTATSALKLKDLHTSDLGSPPDMKRIKKREIDLEASLKL